jgi:integrase
MTRRKGVARTYSAGQKGRNRVRLFADPRSGLLYLEYQDCGKKTRTALQHRNFDAGRRQADDLAAQLAGVSGAPRQRMSLAQLFSAYLQEKSPNKAAGTRSHDRRALGLIQQVIGAGKDPLELTHRDAEAYVKARKHMGDRRQGRRNGQALGSRGIEQDVKLFQAVLNWAVSASWLDHNPLRGFRLKATTSPKRPSITHEEYQALVAVSEAISPTFALALVLAHETGHRVGALTKLRWSDIDLCRGVIRWRSETDKIRHEHETPISPTLAPASEAAWAARPEEADGWVLPSPRNPAAPASRHLMRQWWERAERRAGLRHKDGRGWHCLRRKFATDLKGIPLVDLSNLGGWRDTQTILKCYQQADESTMRAALASRSALNS